MSQKPGHGGPTVAQSVKEINTGSDRMESGHAQCDAEECRGWNVEQ